MCSQDGWVMLTGLVFAFVFVGATGLKCLGRGKRQTCFHPLYERRWTSYFRDNSIIFLESIYRKGGL